MWQRLCANWVYGGFLSAFLLLGLTPLFSRGWSAALLLVFLQLPVYMLHQYEEHDHDRFRRMVNQLLAGGREALTSAAVFVINVPGVWGVNLVSILLAASCGIGWGLIGVYLTLVNGLLHIVQGMVRRAYNPGLVTSVFLFLPLSILALVLIAATHQATAIQQAVGLGAALLIHVLIIAYIKMRVRRLSRTSS